MAEGPGAARGGGHGQEPAGLSQMGFRHARGALMGDHSALQASSSQQGQLGQDQGRSQSGGVPAEGLPTLSVLPPAPQRLLAGSRRTSSVVDPQDWLGGFFDSLCKFARYSRLEVRATLRHGDMVNAAGMVCSLSFDRDNEFFAAAGVCKRIRIFECDVVLGEQEVDLHYPVVEMACRSKLSSVCWNSYIKAYIASADYQGVVQVRHPSWRVTGLY